MNIVHIDAFGQAWPMPMSGQQDLALSSWMGSYQDGNSPAGQTDSAGNWSMTRTLTADQAGFWELNVHVNGWQVDSCCTFTVNPVTPLTQPPPVPVPQGTPYYKLASNWAPSGSPVIPVVSPTPSSQSSTSGTVWTSPMSAVSQANGTFLTTLFSGPAIISGVPNWLLLGGAALLVLGLMGGRR